MRWDTQSAELDEQERLPGYGEPAVVRHYEAPGAVKTRFYEVQAKSILNKVPAASRMPFRWTINPYRGCSHGCCYCLSGDTPVLTCDGRHRPIEDLEVGDAIYGTELSGKYRRYTPTTVLDKWVTLKPGYRITLEDGTELVASGDHRFLTDRGWKHVSSTGAGEPDRAHLTTNNRLIGIGAFAAQPTETVDYRRGYLCGLIRGDRQLGAFGFERLARRRSAVNADFEALCRARRYMSELGVETQEQTLAVASAGPSEVRALRTRSRPHIETVSELVSWSTMPSIDWSRGFLAGVFDASGSRSALELRFALADRLLADWARACCGRLGFDVVAETSSGQPLTGVRLGGGLREHLRFLHFTDPAISLKRSIAGEMAETATQLRVAEIERLPDAMLMYDITTGTGDFIANGVVSHNCFARPTHTYLGFDAGEDFERQIVVKVNAPERLRVELARPSWSGEHVALGTNTDPYQWVEGRYQLMPGIWEAFRDAANPCSVLTKSPLLLRDLRVMREIADRTEFSAALSVPTLEEKAWRATEPHTPHPRARLEAVAELTRAGIRTGVLIAPLMPGINDDPRQVERILELAEAAGAAYVSGIALHLRGEVHRLFFDWLRERRPELVGRYEELYRAGAYAPVEERRRLERLALDPRRPPAFMLENEQPSALSRGRTRPPGGEAARQGDTGAIQEVIRQTRLF